MSRGGGGFLKIIFLLLLIVVIILGGLLWLNYLGVLNIQDRLSFITRFAGVAPREILDDPNEIFLLDNERIKKEREALSLQLSELNSLEEGLNLKDQELKQRQEELDGIAQSLEEKEKSLNEVAFMYENKKANLEQNALYLMGMDPVKAKDIMLAMNNLDVVDLMRTSERLAREAGTASLVAYWISLMPADRAAEIQRLMTLKPE